MGILRVLTRSEAFELIFAYKPVMSFTPVNVDVVPKVGEAIAFTISDAFERKVFDALITRERPWLVLTKFIWSVPMEDPSAPIAVMLLFTRRIEDTLEVLLRSAHPALIPAPAPVLVAVMDCSEL
jgi:hypothetical protein